MPSPGSSNPDADPDADEQIVESRQCRLRNSRPELDAAAETLINAAQRLGYPSASCFALRLALEEAVSNAFHHGHREIGPDADILLTWRLGPERITIVIEDQGPGFDPTSLPDPTTDENLEKTSGRGLLLIRAYMSDVLFNDAGNRVTMIYRKPAEPANR